MELQPYHDSGGLLRDVPLPDLVLLRQHFPRPRVADVAAAVAGALEDAPGLGALRPGARVALCVGSRGIAGLPIIVRATVGALRRRGVDPFIIPAMGSHGGATAEGQRLVLAGLGVTEQSAGAPIVSSLEVDLLGTLPNGLPVHIDRAAHAADGIVVINRVKPHTDFYAPIESGLAKMVAIGLGKHAGALAVHAHGLEGMSRDIPEVARLAVGRAAILLGLAIVENAFDEVAEVVAVPPEGIGGEDERALLRRARSMMACLPWERLDVLVVDTMGKNISGAGMDTNIIGRVRLGEQKSTAAAITNIAVLDVTDESHGNAVGIGHADFTTARLMARLDLQAVYINSLTAGVTAVDGCKLPMILPDDRQAVAAAIRMCGLPDLRRVRLARIESTLRLEYILASPACLEGFRAGAEVEIIGAPRPFPVEADGAVPRFAASRAAHA